MFRDRITIPSFPTSDLDRQKAVHRLLDEMSHTPPPAKPSKVCMSMSDLEDNPMSPYIIPRSRSTPYTDVVDIIRNKPFKAHYSESFTHVPRYYTENNIAPPYQPYADSDYTKGVITIDGMIELANADQPWALDNPEDINIILSVLYEYKEQALPLIKKERKVKISVDRVDRLIAVLEKGRQKVLRRIGDDRKIAPTFKDILAYFKH